MKDDSIFNTTRPGALIEGWIILNAEGKRLTAGRVWSDDIVGWVWLDEQKDFLLNVEAHSFRIKPTHIQKAYITTKFTVQTVGELIPVDGGRWTVDSGEQA